MTDRSATSSWDRLLNAAWPPDSLVQFFSRYPCNSSLDTWLQDRAQTDEGFQLLRLARLAHGAGESDDGSQWILVGLPILCEAAKELGDADVSRIAYEWTQTLSLASGFEVHSMHYPVSVSAVQETGATHWGLWLAAFATGRLASMSHALPRPREAGPWVWVAAVRAPANAAQDLAAVVLEATQGASSAWRMRCEQLLQQALGVPLKIGAPLFLADALAAAVLGTLSEGISRAQAKGIAVGVRRNPQIDSVELAALETGEVLKTLAGRELPPSSLAPLVRRAAAKNIR